MSGERVERRLAAILAADVAGYNRLMGQDEAGTLARLNALRRELIEPEVAEHKGRVVKTTGDGILVEFPSVVEAVACAVAVQQGMAERNAEVPEDQRLQFRVGINSGDVIVEDGDIHGDGVNIAARLEGLAEPGGICVSAMVHDQVQGRLDCGFEDIGERKLKNIARPVRVYRVGPTSPLPNPPPLAGEGSASARVGAGAPLPLPDKPSIAVLPFQNMSGDPEQEYFADGMVEEIITALSRIRWLFVIARNSSFTYKGQAIDVKRIGRELGVRYVLEGSVRKGSGRVRITAQLVEAETGAHLWADRFDGSLEDVFDLQDRVATSVAGVMEPTLRTAEVQRASRRPTSDLTAYDLYLRALPSFFTFSQDGIVTALALFEQAIRCDPEYGPALGGAAMCCHHYVLNGWGEDIERFRRVGIEYARHALVVGEEDPDTLAYAAYTLGYFGEDIATMIRFLDRAVELNPSFARAWYLGATLRMWAGNPEGTIERIEKSMRLSPRARVGAQSISLGTAHFLLRRFSEAAPWFLRAVQETPANPSPYRWLATCYAHMGRLAEAREAIERRRTLTPRVVPEMKHWRDAQHRELFLSGLRLAMAEAP